MTEKGAFPPGQEPAPGPVGRGQACCTSCLSQPLPSLAEARAGTGCLKGSNLTFIWESLAFLEVRIWVPFLRYDHCCDFSQSVANLKPLYFVLPYRVCRVHAAFQIS